MSPEEFLLKAEGLLGLSGATFDDVFQALRSLVLDEDDEDEDEDDGYDVPGSSLVDPQGGFVQRMSRRRRKK